jgi:hypothetical protein
LSSLEAKDRADLCARFVAQHASFPGTADIVRYQRYAEAIARRSAPEDGPATILRRLLSDIFVNHLWMVTITDDNSSSGKSIIKRYYTTKQPEQNRDYLEFSSIISFEGKELARVLNKDRVSYLGLSPQTKVANPFKVILADESKLVEWETFTIDLADAIRRQSDMDPILQVALLRKVVGAAIEGSEPLHEAMATIKTQLDEPNVDVNVPWMNPEAPRLTANRTEAAQLVQSLPDLTVARKKAITERARIEHDITRFYRTVGWLLRSADSWQLRTGVVVPPEGELWVVAPLENKHGEWRKVGKIIGGKPKVDAIESSSLVEGRPVFVIISSS